MKKSARLSVPLTHVTVNNTVSNPVKMHIDTFCATGSDGVVRDTNGACIVAEDGSGQLRVAEAG